MIISDNASKFEELMKSYMEFILIDVPSLKFKSRGITKANEALYIERLYKENFESYVINPLMKVLQKA